MRQPIAGFARYCHIRSIASCGWLPVTVAIPVTSIPSFTIDVTSLNHEIIDDPVEEGVIVLIILDVRYETIHMERGVVGIQLDNNRSVGSVIFI